MKNKKRMPSFVIALIIVSAFGLFFCGVYGLAILGENKYLKEISYEDYNNAISSDEKVVLYYGDSDSSKENKSLLKRIAKENGFSVMYLDAEKLTAEEKANLEIEDESIIFVNEGEVEEIYQNEFIENSIKDLFVKHEYINRTLREITITDYLSLINGENFVVFLGSAQCGYCTEFKPIVESVIKDYKTDIYYIDLYSSTQDEINSLYTSNDWYMENEWGTPTTLIFNKGEITDVLSGYVEKSVLVQFLRTNGVI